MELAPKGPRRPLARRLAAGVAALAVVAGCTTAGPRPPGDRAAGPAPDVAGPAPTTTSAPPRPLQGRPLDGPTGLRLLVAGDPPRLLDVDRGTGRRVGGLPPIGDDPAVVAPAGPDAIVTVGEAVFVVRRGTATARRVGSARSVTPTRDGRGLWLLEHGRRCVLREVGLDGRGRRPPVQVPCDTGLGADTAVGLEALVDPPDSGDEQTALLDPATGRVLARYPVIHGVAGDQVLWGDHEPGDGPFTLTDRRTGARHQVERPTPHGGAGPGLPRPDGRLLAVEFADPAWRGGPTQLEDIWLLEVRTRRWRRLPGMPLLTGLKFMSMAWTDDGRLVLAGDFDRVGEAMAVWRPGQDHLAIRHLDLPDYDGSDSFVPWPAKGA